ncbi:cell wall peptidase [Dinoroseobacter phage vB_DshS-R4C]|nr:cell wall peptidase [Dinoroseobacter phage vB_DshS-R4C]
MTDPINRALVLAEARTWCGTPYVPRASLKGVGCDCAGFIRGVARALCGLDIEAPRWVDDWARSDAEPLLAALRTHALPIPPQEAAPGDLVSFRVGSARFAHVGILTPRGVLHTYDLSGVTESPLSGHVSGAWRFPAPADCETGPDDLTPADCLAVVYPGRDGTALVAVSHMDTATPLALSAPYPTPSAALTAAGVFDHVESAI